MTNLKLAFKIKSSTAIDLSVTDEVVTFQLPFILQTFWRIFKFSDVQTAFLQSGGTHVCTFGQKMKFNFEPNTLQQRLE